MPEPDQLLDVLQADIVAVLKNTPALADAFIFTGSEKDLATRLNKTFGPRTNSTGGKRGLAIQVLPIFTDEAEANLPGPPLMLRCRILTIESVTLNRSATNGTLKTSSQTALNILNALHHHAIGGHALYADSKPIIPEKMEDGFEGHLVTINARANGVTGPGKVAAVHPDETDDIITLTCATAGAAIRYTTDGSYPTPTNGTLYTAPITTATVGHTYRVAAYKTGLNPSDCLEFDITAPSTVDGAVTDGDFILTDADGSVLTDP